VTLPAGAALREGTLDVDLSISGPVDRLVTTGPVNLSNAKMTGFDLGSKMKVLARFAGIPNTSDTVIETLASNLRLDPNGIRADNFSLIVPAIGSLSGNGTISPKQELNFRMSAKLSGAAGSGGVLGTLSRLSGGQQGAGIPFRIQGTTSNPVFVPDVAGIAGGLAGQTTTETGEKPALPSGKDLGEALGGIFGRTKQ
jgi:AsmA protein